MDFPSQPCSSRPLVGHTSLSHSRGKIRTAPLRSVITLMKSKAPSRSVDVNVAVREIR